MCQKKYIHMLIDAIHSSFNSRRQRRRRKNGFEKISLSLKFFEGELDFYWCNKYSMNFFRIIRGFYYGKNLF